MRVRAAYFTTPALDRACPAGRGSNRISSLEPVGAASRSSVRIDGRERPRNPAPARQPHFPKPSFNMLHVRFTWMFEAIALDQLTDSCKPRPQAGGQSAGL